MITKEQALKDLNHLERLIRDEIHNYDLGVTMGGLTPTIHAYIEQQDAVEVDGIYNLGLKVKVLIEKSSEQGDVNYLAICPNEKVLALSEKFDDEETQAMLDYLKHISTPSPTDGFVTVPIEPTEEMYEAGDLFIEKAWAKAVLANVDEIYKVMIAAAPKPEALSILKQHGGGEMKPEELKRYRESMGMSQSEFAERVGIGHYCTISRMERGVLAIPLMLRILINEMKKNTPTQAGENDE